MGRHCSGHLFASNGRVSDIPCKKETASPGALASLCLTLLVQSAFAGCALDDFRLQEQPDGGTHSLAPPGADVDAGGAASCEPGSHRCDPAARERLQICDPSNPAQWVTTELCNDGESCDADVGRCRVCIPGRHRCNGWRLQQCNEKGTDWVLLEECPSPEKCDSKSVQCASCLPEEAYCSGATLLSCNAHRDGYVATECDSPDECNIASMSCRACVPGELQCNRQSLMRCGDDQKWENVEECAAASLCEASLERHLDDPQSEPACVEPACQPGSFRCSEHDGRTLLGCPPDGSAWSALEVCATPEACDATGGRCLTPQCTPGSYRCSGAALELCASDGSGWETLQNCPTPELCNTAARACVACEPGQEQCSDAQLQRCNDSAVWETLETCASAALCDPASTMGQSGRCREPACAPDEYRCENEQLEVCNPTRDGFSVIAACDSAAECNADEGRCDLLACETAGAHRCRGQVLERCADDRRSWELVTTCGEGTLCDLDLLACADQCPDQPYRCNGVVPEACTTTDGVLAWQASAAPCASEALCDASANGASCAAPVCGGTLPRYRCDPSQPLRVQRCTPERDGWETERTCAAGTTCDPGPAQQGPAQCDVCQPGSYACDAEALTRCEADGQRETVLESCRDASHCVAGDSQQSGYCLRCDEGETQCEGAQLRACAADRRGWVDSASCNPLFGCHSTGEGDDYCNVCAAPNELRCSGGTLTTCDAAQRVITEELGCDLGCQPVVGAPDYCRECTTDTAQCSNDDDDVRLVCNWAGIWEEQPCAGGHECHDAGSADYCGSCEPGTVSCFSASQQQECAESGTPGPVRDCSAAAPVCLAATGQCVQCAPGMPARCTGDPGSSAREICDDDGAWQPAPCAGNTAVCNDGACTACLPGATRCSANAPRGRELCTGNGRWQAANCGAQSVCWEGACVQCDPETAAPRCSASDGPGREECVDGEWSTRDCADDLVCVAGACQQCDPASDAYECLPDEGDGARRTCDGGQWQRADCDDPTPLCIEGGTCGCAQGAERCGEGGARQQCLDGNWVDAPCPAGHCQDGACVECLSDADCSTDLPLCVEGSCECDVGSERCTDSGEHEVCAGSSWDVVPCAADTPACNPATGTCVECTSDGSCGPGTPICDAGVCRSCEPDDCPDGICNADSGVCESCSPDNCSGVCLLGLCVPCTEADAGEPIPCPSGVCVLGVCL